MALPDLSHPVGLRDRAMLELLYATGIRRMEVCGLEVTDVHLDKLRILVRQGKGGRDRMLPLGRRAAYWVGRYLQEARPMLSSQGTSATLFIGQGGAPLSLQWLSTVVSQYIGKAQLGKRGACHLFRHSMATLMLEGGADIRYIQAMLGHADLSTTQIYTQVAIDQLQRVHGATHPGVWGDGVGPSAGK